MLLHTLNPAALRTTNPQPTTSLADDAHNGTVTRAINIREHTPGSLSAIHPLKTITTIPRQIIAIDHRQNRHYILTADDDGSLHLQGYILNSSSWITLDTPIAQLPEPITNSTATASFLILLTQSGKPLYLLFNYDLDTYTYLGNTPTIPTLDIRPTPTRTFTATIPATTFPKPIDDLRSSIPDTITQPLTSHTLLALQQATNNAHTAGYWTQPVTIRTAIRLWDGTPIHISNPITINPTNNPQTPYLNPPPQITIPLLTDSNGHFTATPDTPLNIQAYKIQIQNTNTDFGPWNAVIRGIEIWISQQPQTIDTAAKPTYSNIQIANRQNLAITIPTLPTSDINTQLTQLPAALHTYITTPNPSADPITTLTNTPSLTYNNTIQTLAQTLTTTSSSPTTTILGHAGFLHIAQADNILTSHRSNPFTIASSTQGVGGRIQALAPQIRGGGAYTRQFIYLFTDQGIAALTTDPKGQHTNCRIISPHTPSSPAAIATTPLGVYTLTNTGALILLRDATATQIAQQLPTPASLLWDNLNNELWLIPPHNPSDKTTDTIIIQPQSNNRAYIRRDTPLISTPQPTSQILTHTSPQGLTTIHSPQSPDLNQPPLTAQWCASIPAPGTPLFSTIDLGITGTDTDITIQTHPHQLPIPTNLNLQNTPATTLHITGNITHPVRIPLRYARHLRQQHINPRLAIQIQGRLDLLTALNINT